MHLGSLLLLLGATILFLRFRYVDCSSSLFYIYIYATVTLKKKKKKKDQKFAQISILNHRSFQKFKLMEKRISILLLQATMPSDEKHPSRVPMWKGVKASYTLIAACLFPIAIGGYWAYGHEVYYISTNMSRNN